jgi:acyl-coenzyme A thioesterase PaaI-like protein
VLTHHELCFGCGRTNLFGLLLEVVPSDSSEGKVAGRCFIKQDHQGPNRGAAHEGVIAAALSDAMALACGPAARASAIELTLVGDAPVGKFLGVSARIEHSEDQTIRASAAGTVDGETVALAHGTYVV